MSKRAEDVAETRRRIVDATIELHGTLGPARTSIAAVAERAGVTRLTVYRHFPDLEALFGACTATWFARQPGKPDPERWATIDDPERRVRTALGEIYRFYRGGQQMLTLVHADWEQVPQSIRDGRTAGDEAMRDLLLAAFPRRSARLKAALGHAMAFGTWRSLCVEQGLPDRDAVALMAGLVMSSVRTRARAAD